MRNIKLAQVQRALQQTNRGSCPVLPFDTIPGPKPLPLIGNIWRYLPIIGQYDIANLTENAKINKTRYGPIVREQITHNHTILHLFDPNDIEAFFRQDSKQPYRRSHRALLKLRHDNPERYNDGGIFPENGASWSRVRGLFNQYLLREATIARRATILDDVTVELLKSIDNGKQDVKVDRFEEFLYRWSVRCGLAVFLDYTNANMPSDEVLDKMVACSNDQLEALAGTEIQSQKWVKSPHKCPHFQKLSLSEDFMYSFVAKRVAQILNSKTLEDKSSSSYVHQWLTRDKLDLKDVITFLTDCLTANVHTTVYTCMFLIENISRRMDHALKCDLLSEISSVASDDVAHERILSEINERMPILRDCFKETLRLHPVSIGTGRLTQNNMTIRNYHIPPDVMVIAHNQTICRDPAIYDQPDAYNPERWALYRSCSRLDRPSPFAWLPFGFGPRACIGQRLVSLQIYILAIRLLRRFDLTVHGDIKTRTTLVHHLDGHIPVELHRKRPH